MRNLLAAIDARLGDGPRQWADLTVVRNVGPLATTAPLSGDVISNRGCNALLGGGRGPAAYTHFIKLRPEHDLRFERECAVTVLLAEQTPLQPAFAAVPPSSTFVTEGVRLLMQQYCAGTSLERMIIDRPGQWARRAEQVLVAAHPLLDRIGGPAAAEAPPEALQGRLLDSAGDLMRAGLSADAAARIGERLAALPERACAQHGDFWPRNILVAGAATSQPTTWIIDFENCGAVDLPLYDVFHLIRSSAEIAGGWRGDWLQRWATADGAAGLAGEVDAAARRVLPGAPPQAVEAALLACLVDVAVRLFRRGVAPARLAGRMAELEQICKVLDGGALRRILRMAPGRDTD